MTKPPTIPNIENLNISIVQHSEKNQTLIDRSKFDTESNKFRFVEYPNENVKLLNGKLML